MFTLKLEDREKKLNGKQLRKKGIIPAVLYGKHLEESVSMQLTQQEAEKFLNANFIGSKVELEINKKKHLAVLKEATYTPVVRKVEHLSFQALNAGEKIKSVARVIITGKEGVKEGLVMQIMNEISYSALPNDIIDRIEINVEKMKLGDIITVGDLELAKNKNIEILSPYDSAVITVNMPKRHVEEVIEEAVDEVLPVEEAEKEVKEK